MKHFILKYLEPSTEQTHQMYMTYGGSQFTPPEHAHRALLPTKLSPQLCASTERPPRSGEWLYEPKWDGYRLLARIDGNLVKLFTRGGHDWTQKLPVIAQQLRDLAATRRWRSAWIDGEAVAFDERGYPSFAALQAAFASKRTDEVHFYAFDLPYFRGYDLTSVTLGDRRDLLQLALADLPPNSKIRLSETLQADIEDLLALVREHQLEGLVGKLEDSTYRPGERSQDWIKIKLRQSIVCKVAGFTYQHKPRRLKSILLAVADDTQRLHYVGKVGSFSETTQRKLLEHLKGLEQKNSPYYQTPQKTYPIHWVSPSLEVRVSFMEWTKNGRLRQVSFEGMA